MPITPEDPFHWRHYEGEIILRCVRWYLDLPLSYRHVAKLMRERGRAHASYLRLPLGSGVCAGTEQALPFIPASDEPVVQGGRNLY